MSDATKPGGHYSHERVTKDGHKFSVAAYNDITGAWLVVGHPVNGGEPPTLSVQSEPNGNYVGYRDGVVTSLEKLAIVVDRDGGVKIQVAITDREVRTVSLQRLEELVVGEAH